jgi:hypothetical protein
VREEEAIVGIKARDDWEDVYSSTIHNSQTIESAQVPISQGMDKENVVCIHNNVLFGHKVLFR